MCLVYYSEFTFSLAHIYKGWSDFIVGVWLAVGIGCVWLTSDDTIGVLFEIAEWLLERRGGEAYIASKGYYLVYNLPIL